MSEIIFEKIYDQYLDKIYRFVFVRVNSKETAQDLTAETFTRTFEYFKRNPARAIDNVQAFLFRTASNLITDFYRQKSRHNISLENVVDSPNIPSRFARQVGGGEFMHPEVALAKNERVQKIMAALRSMDSEQADIVMWHYVEDMSVREIAVITGRPEGTVRVMLHRGLRALQQLML